MQDKIKGILQFEKNTQNHRVNKRFVQLRYTLKKRTKYTVNKGVVRIK